MMTYPAAYTRGLLEATNTPLSIQSHTAVAPATFLELRIATHNSGLSTTSRPGLYGAQLAMRHNRVTNKLQILLLGSGAWSVVKELTWADAVNPIQHLGLTYQGPGLGVRAYWTYGPTANNLAGTHEVTIDFATDNQPVFAFAMSDSALPTLDLHGDA